METTIVVLADGRETGSFRRWPDYVKARIVAESMTFIYGLEDPVTPYELVRNVAEAQKGNQTGGNKRRRTSGFLQ